MCDRDAYEIKHQKYTTASNFNTQVIMIGIGTEQELSSPKT